MIFFKTTLKGLFKNVQNLMTGPLESRENEEWKSGNSFAGHPVCTDYSWLQLITEVYS